ncbi:hypothetical protein V8E53_003833 [Lactarius tabidus]
MDLPRSRSAEEVVNILYHMPPPAGCLTKERACLATVSRVPGVLAGRGFDIDSLVCCTEIRGLSSTCVVISGQDRVVEQIVYAALYLTGNAYDPTHAAPRQSFHSRARLPEDQLAGGPSHKPHTTHRARAER